MPESRTQRPTRAPTPAPTSKPASKPAPAAKSAPTNSTPPALSATRNLASNILLGFEVLAFVIGAAQFLAASEAITHTSAAIAAMILLALAASALRLVPQLRRRIGLRTWLEVLALLIAVVTLAIATGGIHSPVLALLLLPLTGAAIALDKWGYAAIAVLAGCAAVLLGMATPDVSIESSTFVVWLIGTSAPALIATTAIAVLVEQMQGAERYIQDISSTDRLTGLLNQRAFEVALAREHRNAERSGRPFCVLMIDVENVKQLNETLGHEAGNKLLIAVAAAVARSIRASDVAARFGGDEFVVLLADTDLSVGATVGSRIRSHVYAGTVSVANRLLRANVHLGLACYPKDKHTIKELLVLADQRMRQDREQNKLPASQ